jgi:tRNA(adenine34) deaminase
MEFIEAMGLALSEAAKAPLHGDVPVGAVILGPDGSNVASDHNRTVARADPTAHAEMLAIRAAAQALGDWRLLGHTLVVTLEPCPMCAGAAVWARLDRIVYGASDPKGGAAWSLYNIPQDARLNHHCDLVAGVMADESAALLSEFFSSRR